MPGTSEPQRPPRLARRPLAFFFAVPLARVLVGRGGDRHGHVLIRRGVPGDRFGLPWSDPAVAGPRSVDIARDAVIRADAPATVGVVDAEKLPVSIVAAGATMASISSSAFRCSRRHVLRVQERKSARNCASPQRVRAAAGTVADPSDSYGTGEVGARAMRTTVVQNGGDLWAAFVKRGARVSAYADRRTRRSRRDVQPVGRLEDDVESQHGVGGKQQIDQALLPRGERLLPSPESGPDAKCPGHGTSVGV